MNDTTVFLYFICFAAVAGSTFAFMWRSMGFVLKNMEKYVDRPSRKIHPEMSDVKSGEELLVFKAEDEDEEDDDDGDIMIIRK